MELMRLGDLQVEDKNTINIYTSIKRNFKCNWTE
jgi:hypothetical protein